VIVDGRFLAPLGFGNSSLRTTPATQSTTTRSGSVDNMNATTDTLALRAK